MAHSLGQDAGSAGKPIFSTLRLLRAAELLKEQCPPATGQEKLHPFVGGEMPLGLS